MIWHPWIRTARLMRTIVETRWQAELWPTAKAVLLKIMRTRAAVAREGWFN